MLLPPKILGPLDNLSTFVTVLGAVKNSKVQLFANGIAIGPLTTATGLSVAIPLGGPSLIPGQMITATQVDGSAPSPPSPPEPVGTVPANLPPVTFLSLPHPCADWVILGGMISGATATIRWRGQVIGVAVAEGASVSVPVAFPSPASAGDLLDGFQSYSIAGGANVQGPTTQSLPMNVSPIGEPPPPTLAPPIACDLAVLVSGIQDGASMTVKHKVTDLGPYPYAGGTTWAVLEKHVELGETLSAKQESKGCRRQGGFLVPPVGVNPAAGMPSPLIAGPICPNASLLRVTNLRPGAEISITVSKSSPAGTTGYNDLGRIRAWATECEFPLPVGWADHPNLVAIEGELKLRLEQTNCGPIVVANSPVTALPGSVGKPSFRETPVECARLINANNLTKGASVVLHSDQPDFPQLSSPQWVSSGTMTIFPYRPLRLAENIWISQSGCNAAGESDHVAVAAMPPLAAPGQEPPLRVPRGGAWFRHLNVGGRLYVYRNGDLVSAFDITADRMFVHLPGLKIEDKVWSIQGLCTRYSPESVHETAKGGLMKVRQSPDPIERGSLVQVRITATDADTKEPVNGSVRVGGPIVAATGAPFNLNIPIGAAGPPSQVEAVGYLSGGIAWTLVDPKPPPKRLTLSLTNQSGSTFIITAVTWTVWQQTVSGFGSPVTLNGSSVSMEPGANGQYHIHADVLATRVATAEDELSEFRGTGTIGPGGAVTRVIVWTGADMVVDFSLIAEGQASPYGVPPGLYNPVVISV